MRYLYSERSIQSLNDVKSEVKTLLFRQAFLLIKCDLTQILEF